MSGSPLSRTRFRFGSVAHALTANRYPPEHARATAASALIKEEVRVLASPRGMALFVLSDKDAEANARTPVTIFAGTTQLEHTLAHLIASHLAARRLGRLDR
jgi:hypothetical protein